MDYQSFLATKAITAVGSGRDVAPDEIHVSLFPFQRRIVTWACRRGRAAVFADTGLGKTRMQIEWARLMGSRALILAPLAVAEQTVREAAVLGVAARYCRTPADRQAGEIAVTNYDRLDAWADESVDAVVLDESSILKSFTGATRRALITRFADTPHRLCCTATPAPNDYLELGNHAQFLGIMSWTEMAATFFVHDTQSDDGDRGENASGWRLKGHAAHDFWRWLATWGVYVRKPSDLGDDDTAYALPPLEIRDATVPWGEAKAGELFPGLPGGVTGRTAMRRETTAARVAKAAALIRAEPRESWLVWCGLNDEADAITAAIPDAVQVRGSDDSDVKAAALLGFADGDIRVLVTKAKIAGHGLNFQRCARQVFVGLGDSYEQYYQCIRRSWRFGQRRPVTVYVVTAESEEAIVANVRRKERDAKEMGAQMVAATREAVGLVPVSATKDAMPYERDEATGEGWRLMLGDCVDRMADVPDGAVDFSVYSPPFASLYTYTASERDMGNCRDEDVFFQHFAFLVRELRRVTKPGRLTACHVSQLPAMASRDGFIGMKDFRGRCIQAFVAGGWIHHGEVVIDKNPQAQAIRTKSKALLFVQLRKDASWLRPALADFLLVFRAPGENPVPVKPDISNEDWIKWAHPVWTDIRETHVLQHREGREEEDEKHICPLQLDVIDRAIRLWSNRGETVLSPFAGIGSEGYMALKRGRQFIGVELKRAYWEVAQRHLTRAHREANAPDLFATAAAKTTE